MKGTKTSDTATAYTTAMRGHVNDDDGNGDAVTEARTRTSGHDNNEATGNTMTMNTTTAMDGITVANTMMTGMAGTTTLHNIGDSGGNIAPSIPSSIGTSTRPYRSGGARQKVQLKVLF